MAFFDQLGNLTPDQNQALLSAASQILQASGPSRTPTSIGQILGGGLQAHQQGLQGAQDRNFQTQVRDLQLQELQGTAAEKERARQEEERLRQFYLNRAKQQQEAQSPLAHAQSVLGNNLAPTQANADVLAAAQQAAPAQPQGQPSLYQQHLSEAQDLRNAGFHTRADAAEKAALAFAPKVKNWQEVRVGDSVRYAPFFEDGTSGQPVTLEVARKLEKSNIGGSTEFSDPFTGQIVSSIRNTQSPDSAASVAATLRGQNLTDARLREQNQISQGGTVANVSTELRKEFDQLPEVKNYKQALPAFTSIFDASKRNTPQSDINLVYGIAKLYDPNSVVREGEYNTVANSPNIPERIKGYAQYLAGGGKLSPQVKAQIVQEATSRIGSYENEFTAARKNYSDIATRSGGDASLLFPSEFKPAEQRVKPAPQKISLADIAETARKSGRTTAEVTAAARAKGYTIGD
jgi:hypothetical protein